MNQRNQQPAGDYSNQDYKNSGFRQNRNFQSSHYANQEPGNNGNQSYSGPNAGQNGRDGGRESSMSNWGSQSGINQGYGNNDQNGGQYSQQNSAYSQGQNQQGQNRQNYGYNPVHQNQSYGDNQHAQFGRSGAWGSELGDDQMADAGEYRGTDYDTSKYSYQGANAGNLSSGAYGHSAGSSSQNFGGISRGQSQGGRGNTAQNSDQYGNQRSAFTNYGDNSTSSNKSSGFDQSYRSGDHGSSQNYGSGLNSGQSRQSQSFQGIGPKGYKRSDERLQEDIHERLTEAHHIDASEITVRVSEGKVSLEGSVSDRRVKHQIEDMVEGCAGVSDIDNRITVARASAGHQQSGSASGSQGLGTSGSQGSSTSGSQSSDINKKK